jgi:alkylation response protein AidB-like acyl-CoA dehydrogenase
MKKPLDVLATLSSQDRQCIGEHARQADADAMPGSQLQSLIHERGWLSMLAPKSSGGAELALPEVVRLEESIAEADGSVGWLVTLCAGAGWFAGFLPPAFARELIATPRLCIGGSGAPGGFADVEGDGYRLSGRWEFATGAPLATHITLNAVEREGGQPVTDSSGVPRVRAFIVPARDVQIHDSWRSIGLRASASHGFSIASLRVGAEHAFDIDAARATAPGPLYRFPFASLAYVTIAANISGMGRHFIELATTRLAERKHPATGRALIDHPEVRQVLSKARDDLEGARSTVYRLLDRAWDLVCRDAAIDAAATHALHAASLDLVKAARRAVDELYPFCGLYAAHGDSDLNRVWRDLHTGTQHAMLLPLDESVVPLQTVTSL